MNNQKKITRFEYLIAGSSGLLMTASFPNISLAYLAWAALIPLLWVIRGKGLKDSFKLGWTAGFVFFYSFMYWLNTLARFAVIVIAADILLCLYSGLFWGGFAVLFTWFRKNYPKWQWAWVPILWVSMEYLRGIGILGFPWGWMGFSQIPFKPLIQLSSITGVLGISFLAAAGNGILFQGWEEWKQQKKLSTRVWIPAVCLSAFILITVVWGNYRLNKPQPLTGSIRVSIIQGNIPQDMKWNPEKEMHNFNKYIALTQSAMTSQPELIVWPETAISDFYEDRYDFQKEVISICQSNNCYLLTGAIDGTDEEYYNALILNAPDGTMSQRYYKMHLVPFGEYLPLGEKLPFLLKLNLVPSQFSAGTSQVLMELPGKEKTRIRFGNLICFESLIPRLARDIANQDGDFITIVTNDSWFERTSAPYQHRDIAQFRAIENGRAVIRAANTGYSCFIDANGRLLKGLDIYRDGTLSMELPLRKYQTFYSHWGDWLPLLCAMLLAGGLWNSRKRILQ